ncbi:hypothetical protein ACRE_012010 [Hapsidospora chrysogenum ATCC 11550]|uniref:Uncharacterized protein n=1 Tax=Hapsidospora chrysogenum (strain ATCC 11550 / CBS 779.69 / DSM 880 / IAM 14645 / JCM 23072 / IMI 49137) TaxID=857340 RepID=A0A086TF67_HAPC1|nr:hypothetical protein ACRE_012010 [Hapsidospora chrysogenum ATCC 11550]
MFAAHVCRWLELQSLVTAAGQLIGQIDVLKLTGVGGCLIFSANHQHVSFSSESSGTVAALQR